MSREKKGVWVERDEEGPEDGSSLPFSAYSSPRSHLYLLLRTGDLIVLL